jgi:diadenosine tetraphosphatase ApaH/serine/threonine PP2A family protein phosphatase
MRILVVSDIHANLAAFEAVLADAGAVDAVWCLGDIVGYGPDPNECIARLRELNPIVSLSGNHDWAVLGKLDIEDFNGDAQTAIRWTQSVLNRDHRAYLQELPAEGRLGDFSLAHASPRYPVWEYITDTLIAAENFEHFSTPYCLVGHTHAAAIFQEIGPKGRCDLYLPDYGVPLELNEHRLILNPGSVGQPRDADPRAAYAILDDEAYTWEARRVGYAIEETQTRMREAGMPHRLIARLSYGW